MGRLRVLVVGVVLLTVPAAPCVAAPQARARRSPARTATTPTPVPITEAQALTLLSNAIERDAVYAPMPRACMNLIVETSAPAAFEIAVREKHGGRCPGDPHVAPILDRFRVDRASGAIGVWDILEEDWYSWAEFRRHRSGEGQ